jgi:hypothetical protein
MEHEFSGLRQIRRIHGGGELGGGEARWKRALPGEEGWTKSPRIRIFLLLGPPAGPPANDAGHRNCRCRKKRKNRFSRPW